MANTSSDGSAGAVAAHYDRLDRFYRQLWGNHVHHGLWSEGHFSPDEAVRHLVHRVAEDATMTEGTRVCDIGCGYGAPARLWAREYGAHVTGFTVSAAQYAYAQNQQVDGPSPTYHLQDFLSNDLTDGSVDAAVAIESLTHIRDPGAVFREASRILRPGGRFVACIWMANASATAWQRRLFLEPIKEEGRLSVLPTASDLQGWGADAGLTIRRIDDVTRLVRRTWTVVIQRFIRALFTDPDVLRTLLDDSMPDRVFARTIPRIWLAQHLGILRYGWLVAEAEGA